MNFDQAARLTFFYDVVESSTNELEGPFLTLRHLLSNISLTFNGGGFTREYGGIKYFSHQDLFA